MQTNTPNNRRLLIIKDSFGNPVPSFLFYSFNEVHVVDFRYFKKNMKDYVRDNKITDIALVFNIFSTCSNGSMAKIKNFLTQPNGIQKVVSEPNKTKPRQEDKTNTKPQQLPLNPQPSSEQPHEEEP